MGSVASRRPGIARGSAIEKTRVFRLFDVKNTSKMQNYEFIDGAVVKKSGTTLVKHVLFETTMSKTRRNMTIPIRIFIENTS